MRSNRMNLANRVSAARNRAFVGRRAEQELFRQAVEAPDDPPFTVLHVHGPGGIGKSALLRVFGELAERAGAVVVRIDGREVAADRDRVRAAVTPAMEADVRSVLLVDTYEQLAALDGWLREEVMPLLPSDAVVVLAGRLRPATGWTDDPGRRGLVRMLALAPLSSMEAAELLDATAVSDRAAVLAFCSGYPLALVLAEQLAGSGAAVPRRLAEPDVVSTLLSRLVDAAPSADHRLALQISAWVRQTTEPLLRAVLDRDDVADLFGWLHDQPYVEAGERGLHPHDIVRDALVADLRWRDAETAAVIRERSRAHLLDRARRSEGAARNRAILDVLFILRHAPSTREFFDWDTFGAVPTGPAEAGDREGILDLLERHAGVEGAAAIAGWLDAQPDAVAVCREGDGLLGVVVWPALHDAPLAAVQADPVAAAAWQWAQEHGWRPGEDVTISRCFTDRVAGQGPSPAFTAAAACHVEQVLTRPALAFDFVVTTDPERLAPFYRVLGYERVADLDTTLGGRLFAVFAHDWRAAAAPLWGDLPPQRPVRDPDPPFGDPDPPFVNAVRSALRDLNRPQLARSALIELGVAADATALRTRLVAAAEALRGHPRDEKLFRALDRTYLRPAATQELAAEVLGVPFSSYRRHLTLAVARVAGALWAASRN